MGRPKGSKNKPKRQMFLDQEVTQRKKQRLEAGQTTVLDRIWGGLQPIDYGIKHLTTSEQLKLFVELRDKEMNRPDESKYAEWDLENIENKFRSFEGHLHNAILNNEGDFQDIIDDVFEAEQRVRKARHHLKKLIAARQTKQTLGEENG